MSKRDLNVRDVKAVYEKKRDEHVFKEHVRHVLGPVIDESWSLDRVAIVANDQIEAQRRAGVTHVGEVPSGLLTRFIQHENAQVRKLVASVIPTGYLHKFAKDPAPSVQRVVAMRASFPVVREMLERGADDNVTVILRRRLHEAQEDASRYERVSALAAEEAAPDLTDEWYDNVVDKMLHTYSSHVYAGDEIEFNWEERAVDSFCAHVKATSGAEVDRDRLYNAVLDAIEERDSEKLGEVSLRDMCTRLDRLAILEEGLDLCEIDVPDAVGELVEQRLSPSAYVQKANEILSIEYKDTVPVRARVHASDAVNEHALDTFAKNWEACQSRSGKRKQLSWTYDVLDENVVRFTVR